MTQLIILVKGIILVMYYPIFLAISTLIPIRFVQSTLTKLLLILFGHYASEGSSLAKLENRGQIKVVLSNHLSFLDPLIYLT